LVAAFTKFVVPVIAFFLGQMAVASNMSNNLINNDFFVNISREKAFAFLLSGLAGTLIWCGLVNIIKVPNSASHSLLGGIIGAGIAAFGFVSVQWTQYVIVNIILMVFLAPIIGLVLGFLLMKLFKYLARSASRSISVVLRILQRINLVVLAASFSSNNTQKSLGVFMMMAALGLVDYGALSPHFDLYMVIAIAGSLTLGMLFGGFQVINTVGRKIFKLQDVHSVVAQFTTNVVMIAATELGMPVSTGQVMVSSIMGTGAAERVNSVHWNMAGRIVGSWFLTLPIASAFGAVLYLFIGKLIMRLP
jgi:PiT family inorganic phosphate transporter